MTTISRTGSVDLDWPPQDALLLFTAPGEKLWIDDWDPEILHGDGFEAGTVFVTSNHGPKTCWLVSEFDRKNRRAKYTRVTPDAHAGTVEVAVSDNATGGSTIRISYHLTGLSRAGDETLEESYGESEFAAMMRQWQGMIQTCRPVIDEHFRDSTRGPVR
jgi:hypothetical protein